MGNGHGNIWVNNAKQFKSHGQLSFLRLSNQFTFYMSLYITNMYSFIAQIIPRASSVLVMYHSMSLFKDTQPQIYVGLHQQVKDMPTFSQSQLFLARYQKRVQGHRGLALNDAVRSSFYVFLTSQNPTRMTNTFAVTRFQCYKGM